MLVFSGDKTAQRGSTGGYTLEGLAQATVPLDYPARRMDLLPL